MMIKRKKKPESLYKHETVGSLIIEFVQLPHEYTDIDQNNYKVLTWTYTLRVEDGPVLFERRYVNGSRASINAMSAFLALGEPVEGKFEAEILFYRALHSVWSNA